MAEAFPTIVHLLGSRVARLALCIRGTLGKSTGTLGSKSTGTLGKGTLRMYPSFRVPTNRFDD